MKIKQKPRLQNMFTCFVNLTYFLYPYANLKKTIINIQLTILKHLSVIKLF